MNNISSVVITLMDAKLSDEVVSKISTIPNCEVAAKENDKIVVLIESSDLDGELATFRSLEHIEGVSTVAMIYSYQDLDNDISKANSNDIGEIVRKIDEMDVKDIKIAQLQKELLKQFDETLDSKNSAKKTGFFEKVKKAFQGF